MTKLLLVDLDGTIRESASGNKFIQHPCDQQIIDGAGRAIAFYANSGWLCVGISNQGGVAAGHKQLEDALAEQEYTLQLFPELLCIYICPDFEGKHCWLVGRLHGDGKPIHQADWASEFAGTFRKPQPGMLRAAFKNHSGDRTLLAFPLVGNYLYVGDRAEDETAAAAAGINFKWAEDWRNPFLF